MVALATCLASIALGLQSPSTGVARLLSGAESGDYAQAPIRRALTLARRSKDRGGEGRSLFWLGRSYEDKGDDPTQDSQALHTRARALYAEAIRVAKPIHDWVTLGLAWNRIGVMKGPRGLEDLERALDARRKSGDRLAVARTLNNLGSCFRDRGERPKAISTYWQSVHTAYSIPTNEDPTNTGDDDATAVDPLVNLSDAYRDDRNFRLARSCAEWALDLLIRQGRFDDWKVGASLNNLGLALIELGDYEGAETQLKRALAFATRSGDLDGQWKASLNLGVVDHDRRRFSEAKGKLEFARMIAPNEEDLPEILNTLGSTEEGLGHLKNAQILYTKAIDLSTKHGLELLPTLYLNMGWVMRRQGNPRSAIPWFERALREASQAGDPQAEARALHDLGLAWLQLGERPLAIALMKQAIMVHQRIRGTLVGLPPRLLNTYLDRIQGAYRDLADALIVDGRLPEAQQVLDLLKVAEGDRFLRSGVVTATDVDLTAVEKEWTDEYVQVQGTLGGLNAKRRELATRAKSASGDARKAIDAELRSIDDKLMHATAGFEAFKRKVREAFAKVDARTNRLDAVEQSRSMNRLLKDMGGHVAAVYTLVTADAVRLVVALPDLNLVTRGEPIKIADLNRKVMALKESLRSTDYDPLEPAADLYDILIRPIESTLQQAGVDTVIWSLDSTLRYVPLNCLYDRKTREYAIQKFQSSLFCWTMTNMLTTRSGGSFTGEALAVSKGHTVRGVEFSPLSYSLPEVDEVGKWLHSEPIKDEQFTLARFNEVLIGRPRALHLATHFRFQPGDAEQSFMLLGDGTSLSVATFSSQIADGAFNDTDLLVLSACETAVADTVEEGTARGSEFESFAQLVHEKGAATVVASLWAVEDSSTSKLMGVFYRNLSEGGMTRMGALRDAQLAMLRSTGRSLVANPRTGPTTKPPAGFQLKPFRVDPEHPYAHPFYWAPFVLIGNPR